MSNLKQLTDPLPKPWLNIKANSLEANTMTIIDSFIVPDLEVTGDLKVDGYTHSSGENIGTYLLSTLPANTALPAGTGGGAFTYSSTLDKLVISSGTGVNIAVSLTTGGGFTQLTTPFDNANICWSPQLGLFSGIDGSGTAVYTSPTAVNGTWVIGTPLPTNFNSELVWIPAFSRFYAGSADPVNTVASSLNGSVYTKMPATRTVYAYAYAPPSSGLGTGSGRLITVGPQGGMYTDDGKTWINSASNESLAAVTWSDFWGCFTAVPEGGVKNRIYKSLDGITWTFTTTNFGTAGGDNLRCIIWIQDLMVYMASGDAGRNYISTNGLSWKRAFLPTANLINSYGNIYISEWGQYFSGGTGPAYVTASARRYYA